MDGFNPNSRSAFLRRKLAMDSSVCAALIAGGRSVRMGRDKTLIEWDGQPLWERQKDTLLAIGPDELIISAGQEGPWVNRGIKVVHDRVPALGPLAGLAAALGATRCDFVLALAVDMPCMTASYLESMVAMCADGCGVVPQLGEGYEPMAAVYPKACSSIAESLLNGSQLSLQNFVDCCIQAGLLRPYLVDEAGKAFFRNINFPSDLHI